MKTLKTKIRMKLKETQLMTQSMVKRLKTDLKGMMRIQINKKEMKIILKA